MPRSKRDKKVSLTQTKKKNLDWKKNLVDDIHSCIDKYAHIFSFSVQNMRNSKLKDIRQEWNHSRFFFGKNKVMALALGRSQADEYRPGLRKLSRRLHGQTGLLFTNTEESEVLRWFTEYCESEFARAGNNATQTVHIVAGPLTVFTHDMEPQLRNLGLSTCLDKGVVTLRSDFKICDKERQLTPEQAQILKLFGYKMAQFQMKIETMWSSIGKFKSFTSRTVERHVPPSVQIKPTHRIAKEVMCQVSEIAADTMSDAE